MADAQPSSLVFELGLQEPDRLADKLMGILDSQQVDFKGQK